jgi:hypothetical protein
VALSLGTGILGSLDSPALETLFDGTYGTQFTSDPSVTNGSNTVTARFSPTLPVNAAGDPTADPSWALAGIVLSDGTHTATGTIKVAQDTVTLAGPSNRVNAGDVTLTGMTVPNRTVSVYGRPVAGGSLRLLSTATANNAGAFSATLRLVKSTVLTASINSGGVSATPIVVTVQSNIAQFTAKALGKGKARLNLNGDPNASVTARFYVRSGGSWKRVAVKATDERGVTGVTVKVPTGNRTFKVTYTAPGTATATGTVSATIG